MAEYVPQPAIEPPPEATQGDGPGDVEMYERIRVHFGDRLDGIDDDVMPRFVRGYATEEKRFEVTKDRLEYFLDACDEWHLPTITEEPMERFDECANAWQIFIYGQDKFGHPIVWDSVGSSDLAVMRDIFLGNGGLPFVQAYRYRVQMNLAKYKKGLRLKYNTMIYKHSLVFDLAGFTTSHFSGKEIRTLVQQVIEIEQHLFPETLHKLFLINAPFLFRAAWAIISYFVDPLTYEKVKVVGSGFLRELTKEISLDQIPQRYGGTAPWDVRLGRAHTDSIDNLLAQRAAQEAAAQQEPTNEPEPVANQEQEAPPAYNEENVAPE